MKTLIRTVLSMGLFGLPIFNSHAENTGTNACLEVSLTVKLSLADAISGIQKYCTAQATHPGMAASASEVRTNVSYTIRFFDCAFDAAGAFNGQVSAERISDKTSLVKLQMFNPVPKDATEKQWFEYRLSKTLDEIIADAVTVDVGSGGPVGFLREEFGFDSSAYPFGSSPAAFPAFKRYPGDQPDGPDKGFYEATERRNEVPGIQLHFQDDKLDAIEIWTTGRVVGDFARASGTDVKRVLTPGGYVYSDGHYQLSYRSLCTPEENGGAVLALTRVKSN